MLMQHHQYGIKDVSKEYQVKFMQNGWEVLSNNQIQTIAKEAEEDCGCNQMLPEPKVEPKKRGRPFKDKA
jgi:hypothetical protein